MPDAFTLHETATNIETRIRSRRLIHPDVAWADELIYPAYNDFSLRNIPHTVAELLGVLLPDAAPLHPDVWGAIQPAGRINRVVVFLTDGLGYLYLQQLIEEDVEIRALIRDLSDGRGPVPLTSVVPSTTAVALPTLWSGASPAVTGMFGTTMFLREFSTMANMLAYKPAIGSERPGVFADWGLPPQDFIPVRGVSERLKEAGVPTHNLVFYQHIGTGLSQILHRGVDHQHAHITDSDLWLRLRDLLRQTAGEHVYLATYWGAVDSLAHFYGAQHPAVKNEVKSQLTKLCEVLRDEQVQDDKTLFILTADHGHADSPQVIDLGTDQEAAPIWEAMRTGAGGDYRFAYLYLRAGAKDDVLAAVKEIYADRMAAVDAQAALEAGLFGMEGRNKQTAHRIGDVLLLPRAGWRILDPTFKEMKMVSTHAGLDAWEMLTPLVWKLI